MELLLNLIWLAVAATALVVFTRSRQRSARMAHVPYVQALIALACLVILLFPVISASDDLHPAQAVVEDASKKLQLAIAPLRLQRASASSSMLPAMVLFCLMFALVILQLFQAEELTVRVANGAAVPSPGRAPPVRFD
jgi:cytochrome bd-type quinol oxidase subunit 2